jgi:hypothetical protein
MLQPHRKTHLLPDGAISLSGHTTVKISATATGQEGIGYPGL